MPGGIHSHCIVARGKKMGDIGLGENVVDPRNARFLAFAFEDFP